jgi:hypothetical protein
MALSGALTDRKRPVASNQKTVSTNFDISAALAGTATVLPSEHPGAISPSAVLTNAQAHALETMVALGNLFFNGQSISTCASKPRLFPLIVGPTGAGKSWLVRQAAEKLHVKPLHLTFGSWLPLGNRHDRPTQFTIIDALLRTERVALHLDELDKVGAAATSDWARSIFNDLWNVLDHQLEAGLFFSSEGPGRSCRYASEPGRELIETYGAFGLLRPDHTATAENFGRFVAERARSGLWIVGSGTWQSVFEENDEARRIGFSANREQAVPAANAAIAERIRRAGYIPRELLARFSTELLVLNYPTAAELALLLESLGINALARAAETTVSADDLDLGVAGMRTLESVVTRLLLRRQALQCRHILPPEITP